MIFDELRNVPYYYKLNEKVRAAFEYLEKTDLLNAKIGRYEIDGENVYAIVQHYRTKPLSEGKWEAHRRYIDIQYIIKGKERLGYLNIAEFNPSIEYSLGKDIVFGTGTAEGIFVIAKSGNFVVFTPQDAHMPGISTGEELEYVKKVVIKVKDWR